MNTIRGSIRSRTIQLLLALLRVDLLLRELPLPLKDLLSLHGGEEVMSLEVFRVIMAHALLLHLPEFLEIMSAIGFAINKTKPKRPDKESETRYLKDLLDMLLGQIRRQTHIPSRHIGC